MGCGDALVGDLSGPARRHRWLARAALGVGLLGITALEAFVAQRFIRLR
jgi:hypothetical protein